MEEVDFAVPDEARTRHIYIAGKSQHGKSTLIHWMALQDIDQEKGVCIIDPHGDLVNKLIHYIPKHRVEDTIYFDATAPIPLDFFNAESDKEKDILSDDIVIMFRRLSDSWGVRMDSILRNIISALLSIPGTTFLDIHRMITDSSFRETMRSRCGNLTIRQYFAKDGEFDKERGDSKIAITSRLTKFLLTPSLAAIMGNPNPKLKIRDIMETKKILLVNLANVGQESGDILGALIVSKIQQSAMRRQHQNREDRIPFYLYVDEFQHFQTSAFEVILSEAGKYKLCLTVAHQYPDQLNASLRSAIINNVSTFILFRLNEDSTKYFKGELHFDKDNAVNLAHLRPGKAIYRAYDGSSYSIDTPRPPQFSNDSFAEIIRKRTIELYSCPAPEHVLASKDEEIRPTAPPKRPHGSVNRAPKANPPNPS
jgi:hypothetical protein